MTTWQALAAALTANITLLTVALTFLLARERHNAKRANQNPEPDQSRGETGQEHSPQ